MERRSTKDSSLELRSAVLLAMPFLVLVLVMLVLVAASSCSSRSSSKTMRRAEGGSGAERSGRKGVRGNPLLHAFKTLSLVS